MDNPYPKASIVVDEAGVRDLLSDQVPSLKAQPIQKITEGWDNYTFRIGPSHAARVPRHEEAVVLTYHEQRWLPRLANDLPLPVPQPVHIGKPTASFPWPWTVVPWYSGTTVDTTPLAGDQADRLAAFLKALHQLAPSEAPTNPYRGTALEDRREVIEERLDRMGWTHLRGIWDTALDAKSASERRWMHGDLHPRNLLAIEGALTAVIDWGDMNAGDEATDLACAWMLFDDPAHRQRLMDAYAPSEALLSRATGWAVNFASALAEWSDSSLASVGRNTAKRLLQDAEAGAI